MVPLSLRLHLGADLLVETAAGTAYPSAAVAWRRAGQWYVPSGSPTVALNRDTLRVQLSENVIFSIQSSGELQVSAPSADAVALALTCLLKFD